MTLEPRDCGDYTFTGETDPNGTFKCYRQLRNSHDRPTRVAFEHLPQEVQMDFREQLRLSRERGREHGTRDPRTPSGDAGVSYGGVTDDSFDPH